MWTGARIFEHLGSGVAHLGGMAQKVYSNMWGQVFASENTKTYIFITYGGDCPNVILRGMKLALGAKIPTYKSVRHSSMIMT